jgi:hypothetical protein
MVREVVQNTCSENAEKSAYTTACFNAYNIIYHINLLHCYNVTV